MMRNVHISGAYAILSAVIGAIVGAFATGLVTYFFIPPHYVSYEEYSNLLQLYNELEDKYTALIEPNSLSESNVSLQDIIYNLDSIEGINAIQSYKTLSCVNEYRTEVGIPELYWDTELAKYAEYYATAFAQGESWSQNESFRVIGQVSNKAINAQKAVLDFIEGVDNLESSADILLNAKYTQMGGALYYLPNGDEKGYCYFWSICIK